MRIVRASAAVATTASVVLLAGCAPWMVAGGPQKSEEREISAVTTIVLDTSGDVTISEGAPSLVIRASEGALDRLTSDDGGDTLVLGTTPGPGLGLGEVHYEITVPELAAIELSGSGDIDASVSSAGALTVTLDGSGDVTWSGLDAESIDVAVSGSGDVELDGSTDRLAIELDGSGDIDAEDLAATAAVVAVSGSGNVSVAARDTLSAEISGSGSVTYTGDPSVETDVSGSGSVRRD